MTQVGQHNSNSNYYDNYSCRGGKTSEHYFLVDLTTVQALHSSHQCLYLCKYAEN